MTLTRTIVHASLFAALLAGLAGCATLRTSADYDSHADFASYHTYAFKDVHPGRAAILDHRIKSAVAATLAAKGLREDAANPDLWVVTHARVVYEPSPVTWEIGWGCDRGASPAEKDAAIASAVTKMFEAFPPRGAGRAAAVAGRLARENRG